jgi:hypothetical protein
MRTSLPYFCFAGYIRVCQGSAAHKGWVGMLTSTMGGCTYDDMHNCPEGMFWPLIFSMPFRNDPLACPKDSGLNSGNVYRRGYVPEIRPKICFGRGVVGRYQKRADIFAEGLQIILSPFITLVLGHFNLGRKDLSYTQVLSGSDSVAHLYCPLWA